MRRNHILVALTLTFGASSLPAADYALGLVAFDRGDTALAHREFSALAAQGHPAAQYSLAMLYLKLEPPDYTRAIPWLEKSAGSGLPESQYMLGILSLYGVGTAKNAEKGKRWLQIASGQGNEDAQVLLDQLERTRRREMASEQRQADETRKLQAELDRARASEQALQSQLAASKKRERTLASERKALEKARAKDSRSTDEMRQEQKRLAAEVGALRAQLADAERARKEMAAAIETRASKSEPAVKKVVATATVVEDTSKQDVVTGKVIEVLPDGLILTDVSRRIRGQNEAFPTGQVVFLKLTSTGDFQEGEEVSYPAEPVTWYRYRYESGATGRIRAFRAIQMPPGS